MTLQMELKLFPTLVLGIHHTANKLAVYFIVYQLKLISVTISDEDDKDKSNYLRLYLYTALIKEARMNYGLQLASWLILSIQAGIF